MFRSGVKLRCRPLRAPNTSWTACRPRVHLTYDVEVGGAIQVKELPFVMGVLADLSGKPIEALPKMKDRKFVEIDRDNFNKVLNAIKPRLAFQVDNTLQDDNTKINVELKFRPLRMTLNLSKSFGRLSRSANCWRPGIGFPTS